MIVAMVVNLASHFTIVVGSRVEGIAKGMENTSYLQTNFSIHSDIHLFTVEERLLAYLRKRF